VQLGATLYLFGISDEEPAGRFVVASFDGEEFKELPAKGPKLTCREFWVEAVEQQGRIHLLWLGEKEAAPLDLDPAKSFPGPLREVVFDGSAFEAQAREFHGLPEGQVDVWSDGTRLRVVVQPQERRVARTPSLRLFTLRPEGDAVEDPIPPHEESPGMHFKYFAVARLPVGDRDVFLRGNSQRFEVWEAGPEGWSVRHAPHGLPEHRVERAVLSVLGLCGLAIALGLGMAYQRRRQMRWVLAKLGAQDVLAPVSLRVSAYLLDLGLLMLLAEGLAWVANLEAPRWSLVLLRLDILSLFAELYLPYFVLLEWSCGRTAGKWLLGIEVVTDQGERPTLWRAVVRNLIGFFERHLLFAGVVALPALFLTPRRQRVGDLLGRTLVVQRAAFRRYREERAQAEREKALKPPPEQTPAAATDRASDPPKGDS
jgi:uncharacterized RDD family membrane protein YckC